MRFAAVSRALRVVLVTALAGVGLVAVVPGTATAAGVPCQQTFVNDLDVTIPNEPNLVSVTIDVPDDGLVVADVDVAVNIKHASPDNLTMFVTSVDPVIGRNRASASLIDLNDTVVGADLVGTVFDDAATSRIGLAGAPHTGRFTPSTELSALNDFTGGLYRLIISPIKDNGGGTLHDWSVTITYHSCDFDADGVEDHADQCRDLTGRTVTGCPLASRAATARYKSGRFRGALSSPVAGCKAGRAVSVFKSRRGADARVGTVTTRADGTYKLKRPKKKGRYYATSARVMVPNQAECPAVTSKTFRIR